MLVSTIKFFIAAREISLVNKQNSSSFINIYLLIDITKANMGTSLLLPPLSLAFSFFSLIFSLQTLVSTQIRTYFLLITDEDPYQQVIRSMHNCIGHYSIYLGATFYIYFNKRTIILINMVIDCEIYIYFQYYLIKL